MFHFLLTDFMHVHLQNGTWEGKIQGLYTFRRNTSYILCHSFLKYWLMKNYEF